MKKFDIYQYKAVLLFVCCAVLIGAGACSVITRMSIQKDRAIYQKHTQKSIQLFKEIKARIDNNQATATDYLIFSRMVSSPLFRSKVGMAELNENKREKIYTNYLQQAINRGSQDAKLTYANLLFSQNKDITHTRLNNKEKQAKYIKLKQSVTLTMEVVNTQCEVYEAPYYPKFHAYPNPKRKRYVIAHSDILYWATRKNIKSAYPELYQLAKKVEKTYEQNCKNNKSTKK